jgi:WD40 repeat protein
MKEDLERFFMEHEDYLIWINYELRNSSLKQMIKKQQSDKIGLAEAKIKETEEIENLQQIGLSYFKGNIKSYRQWQNSASKHLDLKGHAGAVYSCKLSKCLSFVLSCSEDRTVRLWNVMTGELLKILTGHLKKVTDCDFHPNFQISHPTPWIVSCSTDCTIRLWNTYLADNNNPCVHTIKAHSQSIYRCSFAPDGRSLVSCSEDKTIRTWCYPECYLLYIYDMHTSPVTTVSFSPTGRYTFTKTMKIIDNLLTFRFNKQIPHFRVGLRRTKIVFVGCKNAAFRWTEILSPYHSLDCDW